MEPKKMKLNSKEVTYKGIKFGSQLEADYYRLNLEHLQSNNYKIEFQKEYILQDAFEKNGKKYLPIKYTADFEVIEPCGKIKVVEFKGFEIRDFPIRKKMFEYKYPDATIEVIKVVPKYLHPILGQFTIEERLEKALKVVNRYKKKNGLKVMRAEYMDWKIVEEINAELEGRTVKNKRNRVK